MELHGISMFWKRDERILWNYMEYLMFWKRGVRILWNYMENLMFWRRGEETLPLDKKEKFKSSIKKELPFGMIDGSATAMGASDLVHQYLKTDLQHSSKILWNYIESLIFWRRGEETLPPNEKNKFK